MKRSIALLCGAAASFTAIAQSHAAVLALDNFEEYSGSNSTVIGSPSSTPAAGSTFTWQETGNPLTNPLTATNGSTGTTAAYIIDGLASAYVKVNFTSATTETLRYLLPAGEKNLSSYDTESIRAKSNMATTATSIYSFITDGNTTYVSTTGNLLTTTAVNYTFALNAASMGTTTINPESLAVVESNATSIGVELINTTAATTTETVAIDDLQVQNVVPEPMSAGLILMGSTAVVLRRRSR